MAVEVNQARSDDGSADVVIVGTVHRGTGSEQGRNPAILDVEIEWPVDALAGIDDPAAAQDEVAGPRSFCRSANQWVNDNMASWSGRKRGPLKLARMDASMAGQASSTSL